MRAEHLYVHVPFCARRCVYCDFSIAVRPQVPVPEYVDSVIRELKVRHSDSQFDLSTLYFGGGTPSKLGGEGVARLVEAVADNATIKPGAEITLEANPEDVTQDAVRRWRDSGVSRVSLGVQSFDDAVLAWMHRTHDSTTATRSVQVLRDGGLDNISIDLIFAMPREVVRSWGRDLDKALELDLPHLSLYGLTVEPRTPLGRWVARQASIEAPEDQFEREFLEADARLTAAGFTHYEVSNYGKQGKESRHNWAYWNRKPYAGLGPSAHEFDGTTRRWNVDPYAGWVSRLNAGSDPVEGSESLSTDQVAAEQVYLNLRTNAGERVSPAESSQASRWVASGWAAIDQNSVLRLTSKGWLRLDSIASDLTAFRSRY